MKIKAIQLGKTYLGKNNRSIRTVHEFIGNTVWYEKIKGSHSLYGCSFIQFARWAEEEIDTTLLTKVDLKERAYKDFEEYVDELISKVKTNRNTEEKRKLILQTYSDQLDKQIENLGTK